MEFTITSSPDFVIRSLTTAAEIEAFYWLNAQVFRPNHDTALIATRRRRFTLLGGDAASKADRHTLPVAGRASARIGWETSHEELRMGL